jgi:hypothetical protein
LEDNLTLFHLETWKRKSSQSHSPSLSLFQGIARDEPLKSIREKGNLEEEKVKGVLLTCPSPVIITSLVRTVPLTAYLGIRISFETKNMNSPASIPVDVSFQHISSPCTAERKGAFLLRKLECDSRFLSLFSLQPH